MLVMDPKLLEILACPLCKRTIEFIESRNVLKCPDCNRVYRIEDNIPIMLIDEAVVEEEK
jgi:uncharacterized protein YbaR (Trm112 family)